MGAVWPAALCQDSLKESQGSCGQGLRVCSPLQLQGLQSQLEFLEQSMVDKSLVSRQEAKIRELENRLEFERTQVKRLEVGTGLSLCSGCSRTTMQSCPKICQAHPQYPLHGTPHAAALAWQQPTPIPAGTPITVIEHPAQRRAALPLHRLREITDSPGPAERSLLYILPLQLCRGAEQLSSPLNIFQAVISLPRSLCWDHKYAVAGSAAGGEWELFFPYLTRCNYFTHS